LATRLTVAAPYGLKIIESCLTCPLRRERLLCDLSADALRTLDEITTPITYPKGAVLFVEGQESRGVFILCSGRVKLSVCSEDGNAVILRISDPGDVVGLPGTISGKPYELTAEVLEPAQVNFIARDLFLRFLSLYGEVAVAVTKLLSEICHDTYQEVRSLGLGRSASQRLAGFLLDWSSRPQQVQSKGNITLTLTHEEIAQIIGASRETVTRLFTLLKRARIIQRKGSSLTICDRDALESMAHNPLREVIQ
jgi:CRP/FNR family transcriptional regulator, cyclic AMP receptor protein